MTKKSLKTLKRRSVLLLILVCLAPSCGQAARMALLLQQTPVNGGSVEPGVGVHRLDGNSQVTLRAVPQPGYQFVTWLGDVDDPASSVTEAYMDSPKIVIAVFERARFDSIEASDLLVSLSSGGLRASAADISSGSAGGAGGKRYSGPRRRRIRPQEEQEQDFPVPDEGEMDDDFPVPGEGEVPEPATIILLVLGGALVRMRTRKIGK